MGHGLELLYVWATGGDYHYRTLMDCLNGDVRTAMVIVGLCTVVGVGYVAVAVRWFRESRSLAPSEAKRAMKSLMWIFLLSAVSGYLWPLIKIYWPVWRAQAVLLGILALHTWNFVLRPGRLLAIGHHLRRADAVLERNDDILGNINALRAHFEEKHAAKRLERT